jgi:hypothetical protein
VGRPVSVIELLPALRDLFSRDPEMVDLESWHLQWILYALNYTDDLEDEAAISAAVEVARADWGGEAA